MNAPVLFIFAVFVLGASLGSFLNVAALRTLQGQQFLSGRSHCPHCRSILSWYQLIPLVSFLALSGRCASCGKPIALRYFWIEAGSGLVAAFLWQAISEGSLVHPFIFLAGAPLVLFFLYLAVSCTALFIFLTDLEAHLIPVAVTRLGSVLGILLLLFEGMRSSAPQYFFGTIGLAAVIFAFFALIWLLTKGRGMGAGDMELAAFLALFLPFPHAIAMVLMAFWAGALFGLGLLLRGGYGMKSKIPFGPFLIIGFFAALFWGAYLADIFFPVF